MIQKEIAFIGGGNMARALIGGLLRQGRPPGAIRVSDPSASARAQLEQAFPGVRVTADNLAAAEDAATWVLAVKPQQMQAVATSLAAAAGSTRPLVISIAAGIRRDDLAGWLGSSVPVLRCMPNRPALLGCGITAIHRAPGVAAALQQRAEDVMSAAGECVWLDDESLLDAVTAVSGSGPAYLFLLIEMLEAAAVAEGIDAPTARRLALHTVHGAARMALESGEAPAVLRAQVTSPGGTTAAALAVLEEDEIRATFARAVRAATGRSRQLSGQATK
jgi:pyrroline-5-carboxylate reductase